MMSCWTYRRSSSNELSNLLTVSKCLTLVCSRWKSSFWRALIYRVLRKSLMWSLKLSSATVSLRAFKNQRRTLKRNCGVARTKKSSKGTSKVAIMCWNNWKSKRRSIEGERKKKKEKNKNNERRTKKMPNVANYKKKRKPFKKLPKGWINRRPNLKKQKLLSKQIMKSGLRFSKKSLTRMMLWKMMPPMTSRKESGNGKGKLWRRVSWQLSRLNGCRSRLIRRRKSQFKLRISRRQRSQKNWPLLKELL